MKHTPGLWTVDDGFSDTRIQGIRKGKPCNIVTGMYDEENEPTLKELEANARLIASAPDLLEILKSIEVILSNEGWFNDFTYLGNLGVKRIALDRIREAIAKAEGK